MDGVLVRSVENTHWHQPLYLIFDSETMPEWFGMPDDKDLPSTFSVEYVRAWKAANPCVFPGNPVEDLPATSGVELPHIGGRWQLLPQPGRAGLGNPWTKGQKSVSA